LFPNCHLYIKYILRNDFSKYPESPPDSSYIHEQGIGDCLTGGPFLYKEIDWLLIPIKASQGSPLKLAYELKDFTKLLDMLSEQAEFPLERVTTDLDGGIMMGNEQKSLKYIVHDYLIIKGYHHLSPSLPPLARRGPRAKKLHKV